MFYSRNGRAVSGLGAWFYLVVLTLFSAQATAALFNCQSTLTGNWSTAVTWVNCNSGFPNNGADTFTADLLIGTTTVDGDFTIEELTVGSSGIATATGSQTVTVNNNFSF